MGTRTHVSEPVDELLSYLNEQGCKGRVVSVGHVRDLEEEIRGGHEKGLLDEEFYRERLGHFDFRIPSELREAKSMIVIAVPRPQGQAVFRLNRESIALIIPPTYVANEKTIRRMEGLLNKFLGAKGFRVARVALPLKLLAVRSGLGLYGRNNICYVSEMGSFLQLVAFYSDLPCKEDSWGEAGMMESCRDCFACRRNCPTGAIPADRFLLRAERCIVFHNEKKGDVPFPVWMDPSWHNCLVGCMRCQQVCPHDRKFLERIGEKEEFSSEETTLLLDGTPRDRLPDATIAKLEHLDLLDDAAILPRNLRVFLEQKKKSQTHP